MRILVSLAQRLETRETVSLFSNAPLSNLKLINYHIITCLTNPMVCVQIIHLRTDMFISEF